MTSTVTCGQALQHAPPPVLATPSSRCSALSRHSSAPPRGQVAVAERQRTRPPTTGAPTAVGDGLGHRRAVAHARPGRPTRRRRGTDRTGRRRPAPPAWSCPRRPARSGSPAGGAPAARPRRRAPSRRPTNDVSWRGRLCGTRAGMRPSARRCSAWIHNASGRRPAGRPSATRRPASATWQMFREPPTARLRCTTRLRPEDVNDHDVHARSRSRTDRSRVSTAQPALLHPDRRTTAPAAPST